MKIKRYRILAVTVAAAVLLAACGTQGETEEEAANEIEEEVKETEEAKPEEGEEAAEPAEPEEPEEELAEEPPEWVSAYKEFLSERENLVPLLLEFGEGGLRGYITGFYLHDLNGDEVPELFVQKDYIADYIYTYVDSHMELRNAIMYDAFGEAYFGFDKRDGQAYQLEMDAGTGTDRRTGMAKISLMETSHDMEKTAGVDSYEGLESVCDAVFGEMEQEDGSYIVVAWEDAVFGDEQFKDLVTNFVPFDFHEITDENIETYITAAYADEEEYCSLETYREKAGSRRDVFDNAKLTFEVRDGEYMMPETTVRVDDWSGDAYYDINLLSCFRENDLVPKFEGDWKQVYREWLLQIDETEDEEKKREICGSSNIPNRDDSTFSFMDWGWEENPVLCIGSTMGAAVEDYYTVRDGKVVYLEYGGREFLGASVVLPILETDYYFKYHNWVMVAGYGNYNGYLYKAGDPREMIWEMHWEEREEYDMEYPVEENAMEYVPEFGVDNPYCQFRGEDMSKQSAMDEVDKLLGKGAAKQLLDVLYLAETDEKAEGPLSLLYDANAWNDVNDLYTWERVMDILE